MSKFLKSFLLLVTAGLFTATGWAETIVVNQETIGINFTTSGKLMSADANSTEEWGYYSQEKNQGGLLAENKWQNFTSLTQNQAYAIKTAGNVALSIQLKKTSNNSIWGPPSTNSFYTENRLLGAYLDDGSILEFSGLPTSGYDVAIIFAGDGGSQLSCVTVNGTDKTYNANGILDDGSEPWGERNTGADNLKQLEATGTSTAERVMYLSDLSGETLTLQTYSKDSNKSGRGTIAAIQIYLKAGTVEKTFAELPTPAWMWDGKKADGSSCDVLTTLPVGTAYQVNGRIFDLDALKIPAKNFTYSFWTMRDGPANWQNYGGFSNASGAIQIQRDGSGSTVHIYPDSATLASREMAFPLSTSTYELVTVVQDLGTLKVYVNGVLSKTDTLNGWASLTDDEATMRWFALGDAPDKSGRSYYSSGGYHNGNARIADARIYDVALSAEQVKALYAVTLVDATYWATFNGDTLASDKVTSEDGFSLQGDAASYITVSGSNRAWNVSGDSWGTQSVLAEDSTTFTLSVNAKTGTNPNGLLFAFGKTSDGGVGGLALRRTDGNHVVLTKGSSTDPILTGEAIAGDINYYNYTIVAAAGNLMLYVNGVPVKDGEGNIVSVSALANELIDTNNFQPGRRYGGVLSGGVEKAGNGAIDEMVAWKGVALTSVQVKNTYDLFLKTALSRRALATAEENWSDAEWNDGDDAAPTQGPVILTSNVEDGTTLTMDASVTLDTFAIVGEQPVTVVATDSNKLTSSVTKIDADVTINAGVATLGAVSVGEGKTLTVKEDWTNVATNVPTTTTNQGKIRFEGGSAETPIVFSMGDADGGNPGALVMAPGSVVKLTATGGNKVYNITGESDGVKPEVRLHCTKNNGWGVTQAGSLFSNVKVVLPENNNNEGTGNTSFWWTSETIAQDGSVDFEVLSTQTITFENTTTPIYFGNLKMLGTISGNSKELTVNVKAGELRGTGTWANKVSIAVDNSGEGAFTVARAYGSALTIGEKGRVIVAEGGSLTGTVSVTGSITNAGTLVYGVDTTASNAISGAGAIQVAAAKTVDLTSATLTNFTGTYSVGDGATLKLPLAATAEKSIALGTDAKLLVVLNDEQKGEKQSVTVTGSGSFQFVDANNNPLSAPNTNYVPSTDRTYDVATETWENATAPSDYEKVIIDFGATSEQTVDLATILGDVTAIAHLTVTGANGGKITNAASIASCPTIIVDTVTMPAALAALADTIEVTTSLSLEGTAEETTIDGVISGNGQVKIASGKVTFPNAKTYPGGTDIAEYATLTITNAGALGTGAITGEGTLVCEGVLPANTNGLKANTWTGTVSIVDFTGSSASGAAELNLDEYGSSTSLVQLTNVTGWVDDGTTVHNLQLEGNGLKLNNGSTGTRKTVTVEHLTGSGTFSGAIGNSWKYLFIVKSLMQDDETFTGSINLSATTCGETCVLLGTDEALADVGKIVVAKPVTIATGAIWSAVNGIKITENGSLTVNGSVTSAVTNNGTMAVAGSITGAVTNNGSMTVNGSVTGSITNAGTLVYGVDTTASNAISGAGAIQVADAKTVDLTSATLTSFTGTYSVGEGAILKLPLAATAEKEIELGTDAKLLVVLNDEQKGSEQSVTVTGGSVQFVDANGNVLCNGASYTAPIYTVGEGWTGANRFAGANIVIDFAETEGETVDLTAILGSVTTLSKLTVTGTNGGTLAKSGEAEPITITTTVINTNTIVEAGVASLGTVTIADDKTLTVKDTATVSTLSGQGVYNLDLGGTTADAYTFAADGKNYKVSSGTFTNATLNLSGTQTNYEFAGGTITMATAQAGADHGNVDVGQFSFGTADVTISDGTINATHLVTVQGDDGRSTTINQTGGDIILSGTGDGSDTRMNQQTIMFGHWRNATSSYTLSGGSLQAENGGLRFGNNSPSTMEISNTGLLKVKGIKGKGEQTSSLTMTGGTLSLGDWGFNAINNFTFAVSGGEINAYGNATINQALVLDGNATLSAAEDKTMTVTSAITGTATLSIDGAGTVDLSGATIDNTIALDVQAGATVTVTADQLSTFAKVTIPETATLKVKGLTADNLLVGRLNCTLGEESEINGTVVLDGVDGTNATVTDGVLSVTFTANPTLTGSAWWWDYEFDGQESTNERNTQGPSSIGSDEKAMVLEGSNTTYTDVVDGNRSLYFQKTPWRGATFSNVDAFTAVMYCKPGEYDNTALVGFGSVGKYADSVAIALATGANAAGGEMKILLVKGRQGTNAGFDEISLADKLIVPNATEAYHLYAFTFNAQADKTVISVYVDGKLKKTTTMNGRFHVADGFQIGSLHGGLEQRDNLHGDISLTKYPASGNSGALDFLRVTKGVLSAEAMRALAEAYPYHSKNGTATRTVAEATVNWVAEGTWSQTVNDETTTVAAPNNGTNVTLTANVETAVTVNLEEAVTYETVTVVGNAAVTFNKGTATFSAGDITIGTDVTIEYGAVDVDTLIVNGGKTLTFDFTDYDFNSIYASKTLLLTGLATLGENARVTVSLPPLPAYLTAECVFDASKSGYALAITVTGELSAVISQDCTWDEVTWKMGETTITRPADLSAFASIPVVLTQDATLTLGSAVSLNAVTVSGGTLTLAGAGLTVTTLTLNGANVVATPDTLMASIVSGTVGTERLTMDVNNNGTGEYTRAMALSNCAFTKAGAGRLILATDGIELNNVDVTLASGELKLSIYNNNSDAQIEKTTFNYAGGTLTSHGWVRSTSQITFDVPEGVNAEAFSNHNLTEPSNAGGKKCSVEKTGEGTLTLYLKPTPYAGTTTVSKGTMVYAGETCTLQGAVSVAKDAAIKGSANCTFASLTFEAGAIVDATDAPVTATTVILPSGEGAKVVLKKNASGDVLTYTGDVPNMNLFTTATTLENKALGLGVKVNDGVVTLVLTQVPVPEVVIPDDATEEVRAELVKQQAEAEVAAQVVADALAASTEEGTRTANVTAIENPGAASIIENAGVELIENDENPDTYTAKFTYDFGISELDVVNVGGQLYVVVKAELDDDYSFAENVTVSVTDGANAVEGAVSVTSMDGTTTTDAPTGNMRYFRFPLPTGRGTHSYRVRASK